ncbi:MAG TPA: hypothetical protein VGG34_01235 [Opitutaceae bacterium]|jgi:hypothetical protein
MPGLNLRRLGAAAAFGIGLGTAPASRAANVPDAAREAGSRLRADQKPGGYWLTAFTPSAHFGSPNLELNTFLPAMLLTVLDPAAGQAGLSDVAARARGFVSSQIEASGLVRYYGRTDGNHPPGYGGAIAPDADDTALAWTTAGGDAAQAPRVVAALDSHRTPAGLYRTWLSAPGSLVGVNPGSDPNPPDIGIQLDVLAFLARYDSAGATRLLGALRPLAQRESLWVYYRKTPLVPLLRGAELRRLGYGVDLPAGLVRASVPGQAVWVRACELLSGYISGTAPGPSPAETAVLLARLSGGGFSEVRGNPPLLYHNDLSASVGRYYWSEDFGYALWIRLSREYALASAGGAPRR